jgi:CBS domain-containing protein
MKVSDVISGQHLVTSRLDSRVGEIAELMKAHRVTGVPVVDEWGALAGLVTSSIVMELARAWSPAHHDMPLDHGWGTPQDHPAPLVSWTQLRAADVMTSDLVTVMHDHDVVEAAQAMMNRGVHRVVVLGKDRNVVGVLSAMDFARLVATGTLK